MIADGGIVGEGRHEDLIAGNSEYARLYELQGSDDALEYDLAAHA